MVVMTISIPIAMTATRIPLIFFLVGVAACFVAGAITTRRAGVA
jgi:hypothetical protein